jgi:hypothetical protein
MKSYEINTTKREFWHVYTIYSNIINLPLNITKSKFLQMLPILFMILHRSLNSAARIKLASFADRQSEFNNYNLFVSLPVCHVGDIVIIRKTFRHTRTR